MQCNAPVSRRRQPLLGMGCFILGLWELSMAIDPESTCFRMKHPDLESRYRSGSDTARCDSAYRISIFAGKSTCSGSSSTRALGGNKRATVANRSCYCDPNPSLHAKSIFYGSNRMLPLDTIRNIFIQSELPFSHGTQA